MLHIYNTPLLCSMQLYFNISLKVNIIQVQIKNRLAVGFKLDGYTSCCVTSGKKKCGEIPGTRVQHVKCLNEKHTALSDYPNLLTDTT